MLGMKVASVGLDERNSINPLHCKKDRKILIIIPFSTPSLALSAFCQSLVLPHYLSTADGAQK